ncbi:rare lipoprotein A [Bauldia litoralis]|uniref:Endolytic peptidoglycan transglycosylase RlpA n=2 Tax=Bauldia litoralis TaxID=665467 RepID=A0A1G6DT98_9HYPH|nr:rare lipoprotein A [Bauldia litoralis]
MGFVKSRIGAFGMAIVVCTAMVGLASQAEAASQCGKASWYKMGTKTASGEKMNARALAAAHKSLPFGTKVRVENLSNGRSVVVRINDRGPFTGGRVIDLTQGAAEKIGMINSGVARVKMTVVGGKGKLSANCS